MRGTLVVFIALTGLLALSAAADATVIPRLAGLEAPTTAPYDFDQVSAKCPGDTASRDTSIAYAGAGSLKVHSQNDAVCGQPYARGILETNSPYNLVEGDKFWFGTAIYLPTGFYSAHTSYTDLLRVDSYVKDDSTSQPVADRAEVNFASWDDDSLHVAVSKGESPISLIGPLSTSYLPEGQ